MGRLVVSGLLVLQASALPAPTARHYLFSYFINNGEDGLFLEMSVRQCTPSYFRSPAGIATFNRFAGGGTGQVVNGL